MLARFDGAGMSLGALSPEAHEALAIAMNRLGGRSNSGEGGEDPARYGTEKNSKIKQVASGRFGVTPEYLTNAEVLQIKIAQGAKPGEGGQLPGPQGQRDDRAAALRAARRRTDLAAAASRHLFDRGPGAADLRSEAGQSDRAGVGEAGGRARRRHGGRGRRQGLRRPDHDLRATTAAPAPVPLSSIKYAGTPWELGLAETHQTLRANDMRHRVRVQTDGGLEDRGGRHQGGDHRRRELRLRHRAGGGAGLQVPAHLPPEQLRHRRRDPACRAALEVSSSASPRWS